MRACSQRSKCLPTSLGLMQPLCEVTLTRPWHWGIAIVSAPGAELPELLSNSPLTVTPDAVVIKVRHAQDIDAEVFEGDWDWATATILVRSLAGFERPGEPAIYDGTLRLPGGRLAIGDADSEVVINDLDEMIRVRVAVLATDGLNATDVRIELHHCRRNDGAWRACSAA